jgi:hypothetical protein
MRYTKLGIILLAFSAALIAADPFAGTWTLNGAKTKYKTGSVPKEQTLTISEAGSDLDVTIKGTSTEGTPISTHYTVPALGGKGKIIESPYREVTAKRKGANQREVIYSKGGKVGLTAYSKVAADGKTLTITVKGTDTLGKPVDGIAVYDKQ